MNIVLFAHPPFLASASMPRYTQWLQEGMTRRGHRVQVWAPQARCYNWPVPRQLRKWTGYLDQFLVFPAYARRQVAAQPSDTLYVFTDHALGPWVPLVASQAHVIHCHDFLAQQSALGRVPQNPVSRSGRIYQRYIRAGFTQGRAFIAVSKKTNADLQVFVDPLRTLCHVVYNGVNPRFHPAADVQAQRTALAAQLGLDVQQGFVLHVGVDVWYKNRRGVLEAYEQWRAGTTRRLPLLMVGPEPPAALAACKASLRFGSDVFFLSHVPDDVLVALYGAATVFLFPSIAEGFGWPIAEAMAAGCPVITTDAAPMTEVAGTAGFYVPPPGDGERAGDPWAAQAADVLDRVVGLSGDERRAAIERGFAQVRRFDSEQALDRIEHIYEQVLMGHRAAA